jgi:zinc-ribbon domain
VAAGNTVTVSGQNWVPPQAVSINIAGCAACEPGNTEVTNVSVNSTGLNSGSFSKVITIPASTRPGNYVVDALTPSGLEAFYTTGIKHLTITAAPAAVTPTPSPSATAQVSATPTKASASPTTTGTVTNVTNSTNTGNSSSNTGGGNTGNSTLIIALLVSAVLLFLVAALVVLMMMRSSKKRARGAPQPSMQNGFNGQNIPPGQFGQFNSTGSSPGNFPQQYGQPGQQPSGNGFTPPYAQPTEAYTSVNNFAQRQAMYAPTCPNCGRPLAPNAPTCSVCGMPVELMRR